MLGPGRRGVADRPPTPPARQHTHTYTSHGSVVISGFAIKKVWVDLAMGMGSSEMVLVGL